MNKRVLQLAIPMILSNLTVPMVGLVDTAVMGHLSHSYYLAAVGIGAMLFDLFYWCFGFLRMGTTSLASQAFGRQDQDQMALVLLRHVAVAILIGLLLLLLQVPMMWAAFHIIHASPVVIHYAKWYFHLRIWAAPAAMVNIVILGWLIGVQKPRRALLITAIINAVSALLDLVLVYGFHMTVDGVALASVVAQYVGLLLGGWVVYGVLKPEAWRWQRGMLFAKEKMTQLFRMNRDIFIRTMSLLVVFVTFTRQGALFGATMLAANVVLMNLQDMMAFALDGFANAAEALVGEAVGKQDQVLMQKSMRDTAWFSLAVALVFAAVYALCGRWVIHALTGIDAVRHMAMRYLPYMIASPLVSVWSYWLDGIFVGASWVKSMRNSMLISALGFFVILLLLHPFGNHGLWWAFLSFMALRGLSMGACLWKYKRDGLC